MPLRSLLTIASSDDFDDRREAQRGVRGKNLHRLSGLYAFRRAVGVRLAAQQTTRTAVDLSRDLPIARESDLLC